MPREGELLSTRTMISAGSGGSVSFCVTATVSRYSTSTPSPRAVTVFTVTRATPSAIWVRSRSTGSDRGVRASSRANPTPRGSITSSKSTRARPS